MARILVVEDEPDLAALLRAQLSSLGYEVVVARDGAEGLDFATTSPPDVLLTDVIMPLMDGLEMLERLRTRPDTRLIPAIVLSARTDPGTRSRLLALGVRAVLAKPYTLSDLSERIREATPPVA